MSDIVLNDFVSFNRFLFDGKLKHPNWKKFRKRVGKKMGFVPPIVSPKTIEEYQLNHYAYWMFIAKVVSGVYKLPIFPQYGSPPCNYCYACEYLVSQQSKHTCASHSCYYCPISNEQRFTTGCRNTEYLFWKDDRNALAAMAIARTLWKEPKQSQ